MFPKKKQRSNHRERDAKGVTENGEAKPTAKQTYSKFGSKACISEGIKFDSELELRYYKALQAAVTSGHIKHVKAHPEKIILLPTFWMPDKFKEHKNKGRKDIAVWEQVCYNPDFKITLNDGTEHYIDTKSIATLTDAFVLKVKMMSYFHGMHIVILYREMLDFLPNVFADLSLGRIINPVSKKQMDKLIKRWKGIE